MIRLCTSLSEVEWPLLALVFSRYFFGEFFRFYVCLIIFLFKFNSQGVSVFYIKNTKTSELIDLYLK